MTQRILRRATAVAALTATVLALSGCASWQIGQRAWASSIEKLAGVDSLKLSYSNNWPSSGVQHTATLVLAPDITEDEARAIAAASCESTPLITSFLVSNSDSVVGSRLVEQYAVSETTCIDADELARFAQVSATMEAMGPAFEGNFGQLGWLVGDPRDSTPASAPPSDSYRVVATVADDALLVDVLLELDARITGVPLSFGGTQAPSGQLWLDDGPRLEAWLSPDADVERLAPAVTAALSIPYTAILVTDDSITVRVAADADLVTAEIAGFRQASAAADLQAGVSPLLLWSGDPDAEQRFFSSLQHVQGGAELFSERDSEITVQTASRVGLREAAELLIANGSFDTLFRVRAPEPGNFTVSIQPDSAPREFPAEAFAAAEQVHAALPGADRVGFQAAGDERKLSVRYVPDTPYAEMQDVRETIEPLTAGDVFTQVVVQPNPKQGAGGEDK